jgi:quercetin dioxygenase-like cupin family protein
MVRGQQPRVMKEGDSVYIPRGTIHRNENQSGKLTRTLELLIVEKDKPQRVDAPPQ